MRKAMKMKDLMRDISNADLEKDAGLIVMKRVVVVAVDLLKLDARTIDQGNQRVNMIL